MDAMPSIIHGHLKYEYDGNIHTIIGDPELYTLCNLAYLDIKRLDLTCFKFHIIPKEVESTLVK